MCIVTIYWMYFTSECNVQYIPAIRVNAKLKGYFTLASLGAHV